MIIFLHCPVKLVFSKKTCILFFKRNGLSYICQELNINKKNNEKD